MDCFPFTQIKSRKPSFSVTLQNYFEFSLSEYIPSSFLASFSLPSQYFQESASLLLLASHCVTFFSCFPSAINKVDSTATFQGTDHVIVILLGFLLSVSGALYILGILKWLLV